MGLTKPATFLLVFHVIVGTIALLSGAGALLFKKGSRPHRISGNLFVISMVLMTSSGLYLSILKPVVISMIASVLTFYLVVTSWLTIKRPEGKVGRIELASGIAILSLSGVSIWLGVDAIENPVIIEQFRIPPTAYFMFGFVSFIAGTSDIFIFVKRGIDGAKRIVRHLWRMCYAMFIATSSIFQVNPQVFPEELRNGLLLGAPTLIVVGLMIFWFIRVRFTRWRTPSNVSF